MGRHIPPRRNGWHFTLRCAAGSQLAFLIWPAVGILKNYNTDVWLSRQANRGPWRAIQPSPQEDPSALADPLVAHR